MTPNSEQVEKDAKRVANIIIASIKEEENAEIREAILSELSEALSQPPTAPTVTAEELWEKYSTGGDEEWRTMGKIGFLASISEATASLQSEVTQLRKELAIAEEAARLGKLSIHEQFLATNKMAETIVENQRLTAEVEKLKQRVESAYKAGWESAYHKGQRQHESFEEWKASRGKGSGDQPNAG